jgi:hypothetical protein
VSPNDAASVLGVSIEMIFAHNPSIERPQVSGRVCTKFKCCKRRYVVSLNVDSWNDMVMTGTASFWLTELRGKGSKLGEPCPKDRLSQDRLPSHLPA